MGSIGKRVVLFLSLNIVIIVTISFILSIFHVQPYLTKQGIDYNSLMTFCVIWGMGGAFISLALSRIMAKFMMGIRVLDPKAIYGDEKQLVATVYKLAKTAGLADMPEVGIYDSSEVNAFATGPTKKRSLVAVSRGLLNRMDQDALEGVLGHEIAHIANGDMVTMTLLQGVVNAFVMFFARVVAYVVSQFGRRGEEGSSQINYFTYSLLTILFEIIFMIAGSIIVCGYSRWREFRADAGGAQYAGREKMKHALESLQRTELIKDPQLNDQAIAAFKISSSKKGFFRLFMSHPPLEERIARLEGRNL